MTLHQPCTFTQARPNKSITIICVSSSWLPKEQSLGINHWIHGLSWLSWPCWISRARYPSQRTWLLSCWLVLVHGILMGRLPKSPNRPTVMLDWDWSCVNLGAYLPSSQFWGNFNTVLSKHCGQSYWPLSYPSNLLLDLLERQLHMPRFSNIWQIH